jgi:hypothetical protein
MHDYALIDLAKDHQREIREIAARSRRQRGGESLMARLAKRAETLVGTLMALLA